MDEKRGETLQLLLLFASFAPLGAKKGHILHLFNRIQG